MKNIKILILETITDIEENKKSLSMVLNRMIRILNIINDIDGSYFFFLQLYGTSTNSEEQKELEKKLLDKYITEGIVQEEANKKMSMLFNKYLATRKFSEIDIRKGERKDKVCVLSVSEIEAQVESIQLKIERNTVPDGLAPIDKYYKDNSKRELDLYLTNSLNEYKKILSRINNEIYNYITKIENNHREDKDEGENSEMVLNKNVFIIHGHNEAKWRELEKILKDDFNLNPIVLKEQPDGGATTIIDKFEKYAEQCSYAFAIFTPDDIVKTGDNSYFQARPNVIYEIGWFSARLGRRKVCIIFQNDENAEIFSDFQGIIQKRFYSNISEIYREIQLELKDIGLL